jgi:hypothetical protein
MTKAPNSDSTLDIVARPDRRFLSVELPVALCLTSLWVVAGLQHLTATFIVGVPVVVLSWVRVIFTMVARTTVGPDGIHNRMLQGERHLAWDQIEAFEIRRGVYGRVLTVLTTDGEAVGLGAPRDRALPMRSGFDETVAAFQRAVPGDLPLRTDLAPKSVDAQRRAGWAATLVLLLLAVGIVFLFDQPWNRAFWPGRQEAVAVPSACEVLRSPSASRLIPSGTPTSEGSVVDRRRSACDLNDPRGGRRITVRYELSSQEGGLGGSASDAAHHTFAVQRDVIASDRGGTSIRVRGLGDEAQIITRAFSSDASTVDVVVRRANVVLTVHYLASEPPQQMATDAQQVARRAVDLIRVR